MNLTTESNEDWEAPWLEAHLERQRVVQLERTARRDARRFEFSLRRLSRRRPHRGDEPGHYQLVAANGKVLVDVASLDQAITEMWAAAVRRYEGRL